MTTTQHRTTRAVTTVVAALLTTLMFLPWSAPAAMSAPASAEVAAQVSPASPASTRADVARLTNLGHLDSLGATVTPPPQSGHTTYGIDADPTLGVLWTYADRNADGTFRRVGGGAYDAATNTYSQGAFNADDVARAAVVYVRHWTQTGDTASREHARQLLRGLTYLQTATGPNAGNVVLWMQPDGTLHPSPVPKELPDPSDSGASYWLARTTWALGEGYAAFRHEDPQFATFLAGRLDLAVTALERQVLTRYGQYLDVDGRRTPAWLIVDGADASAEAVLGLTAYVGAGGTAQARKALRQFADGISMLQAGDARNWPFGGVLPWALSRSDWHAWASQMPAALARASVVLGDQRLARAAATDSGTFDPWMLNSGGPDNGRLPTAGDTTQIAYGADSRVQSLVATAEATGSAGPRRLAGMTAAWFFGANTAGVPAYDPATGVTIDGISGTGVVNRNSGAESTIHGVLTMLALDANPDIARLARVSSVTSRAGLVTVQAEGMPLTGDATAVTPASTWTGESLYGGTGFVRLGNGGSVTIAVPDGARSLVLPVVNLEAGSRTRLLATTGRSRLGSLRVGDVGPQGASPAPGALLPVTLPRTLDPGPSRAVTLTAVAPAGQPAAIDAVMVLPLVSTYVLGSGRDAVALLSSASTSSERASVAVPGQGRARVEQFDGSGRLVRTSFASGATLSVDVVAAGFTVISR